MNKKYACFKYSVTYFTMLSTGTFLKAVRFQFRKTDLLLLLIRVKHTLFGGFQNYTNFFNERVWGVDSTFHMYNDA